ncbi:MAG: sigma-54-dependent Fis family transcriptional regulator [Holophaga sp.]|nr:sigma-54-dependent Fis family transcriptional regulator [Holophaga sp.]
MRADDLDHKELLELDPEEGVILFAGQRALLLDAVAMGLLRRYLVENFGLTAARAVLTQFGFAHGWRVAEAMRAGIQWDSEADWCRACTRIHALEGLFRVESDSADPISPEGVMLVDSYEAEQHLLHFGRAEAPTCWTICGLLSGYLSRTTGEEIYVLEDRCLGKGDAGCHLVGRTRAQWGDERAEDLRIFRPGPFADYLDLSLHRVAETLEAADRRLKIHREALARAEPTLAEPHGTVAKSPAMRKVLDLAMRVAKVDSTVLITGESGTGKERIARLIHDRSARALGPFIAVNCGAITETLLESELFGHARGAFTGAGHDRPGLFESANRGTLLLDEIGEVSPGMQVKLLRALQEREIRRVGENKARPIDVRVLAATNRDLALAVAGGAFRQDLFYRLRVVELHVPPLRERADDILPLARVLLASSALGMNRRILGLSPATAQRLLGYGWPGNVRELENTMERAAALATGTRVELDDLPEEIRSAFPRPVATEGMVRPLDEIEEEYIRAALERNNGNQTRTARQLKIGAATLYRKLKGYGVVG